MATLCTIGTSTNTAMATIRDDCLGKALLWPTLLGEARLAAIAAGAGNPSTRQVLDAVLSTGYEPATVVVDHEGMLVANPTQRQAEEAQQAACRRVLSAIELTTQLVVDAGADDSEEPGMMERARATLAGLVRAAPASTMPGELARALRAATPEALDTDLMEALEGRSDGLALSRMVAYGCNAAPLTQSLRGLGAREAWGVARFALLTT